MNIKISKNSDPFKKYWWVLLLIFSALGLWIAYPSVQSGQGLDSNAFGKSLVAVRQIIDAVNNPEGAPGSPIGLAMNDSGPYKKSSGSPQDSLYSAPPQAAPQSAASSPRSFADDLKAIVAGGGNPNLRGQSGLSAAGDVAIVAPALGGGGFGGSSGGGGSGAGAYSGASFSPLGPAPGVGNFGESQGRTGLSAAKGAGVAAALGAGAMNALKSAAQNGLMAAHANSNALAAGGIASNFDGAGFHGIAPQGGGQADSGVGIGATSGVPMNLKANPKQLGLKKIQLAPPMPNPMASSQQNMMQQMMMMMLPMLMMAMMGGA
ncbi:MAG: hypothetical protein ACYCPQ_01050 [Elusimicrobiota bacterium]